MSRIEFVRSDLSVEDPSAIYNLGRLATEILNENQLSPAEKLVLDLSSHGLSTKVCANFRSVTFATIAAQRKRAISKLGARNTTHAVRIAFELGILIPEVREDGLIEESSLSTKEYLTLELASLGLTNEQIAMRRRRSVETVKSQKKKILGKLNATNSAHAVRRAYEVGIFSASRINKT